MLRQLAILLVVLFCCNLGQAQKNRDRSDGVEIIEFEDSTPKKSKSRKKSKKRRSAFGGAIVKTNPFSNVFGWQFAEIEYPLQDFLSVQAGLGTTFRPAITSYYDVLVNEVFYPVEQSPQWGSQDVFDNYNDNSIRNYGFGFYGSISARFFVYNDAPDGHFLSVKGRMSSRNIDVQRVAEGAQSITRLTEQFDEESLQHVDFIGSYGYQQLFERLTIEYSVGLGYRVAKETRQDIGSDNFGRFYNGTREFSRSAFRYEFGFRIGYQL